MAITVRISGTRRLQPAGASFLAGRGWVSPMPGDLVEVRLQDGAWVVGTVSLYGNYPGGTSLRVSVDGGEPTYFARCHIRVIRADPSVELSQVSSTSSAKRKRRHRRDRIRRRKISAECFAALDSDAETAESSNECYL